MDETSLSTQLSTLSLTSPAQHDELTVLSSIYPSSLSLFVPAPSTSRIRSQPSTPSSWHPSTTPLRLTLTTTVPVPSSSAAEYALHLLLTLPPAYPSTERPIMQILDKYVGPHKVDQELFAGVLRAFFSGSAGAGGEEVYGQGQGDGVRWEEGEVCLFEGVEWVRERVGRWVEEREKGRETEVVEEEGAREEEVEEVLLGWEEGQRKERKVREKKIEEVEVECPVIFQCEAIVDRKSVFIGHAASVHSLAEVQAVMSSLLSDKKIAKATHNISAYRIQTSGGMLSDNDDDGENAAGSRLAHLLTLLEVVDVIVVVSRWYGGIQLGADRFKHINAAARASLEEGGFLEEHDKKVSKKHPPSKNNHHHHH